MGVLLMTAPQQGHLRKMEALLVVAPHPGHYQEMEAPLMVARSRHHLGLPLPALPKLDLPEHLRKTVALPHYHLGLLLPVLPKVDLLDHRLVVRHPSASPMTTCPSR